MVDATANACGGGGKCACGVREGIGVWGGTCARPCLLIFVKTAVEPNHRERTKSE